MSQDPMREEALQQAHTEGLTLRVAKNTTGYCSVRHDHRRKSRPYEARVRRGGKLVYLGDFATAEDNCLLFII